MIKGLPNFLSNREAVSWQYQLEPSNQTYFWMGGHVDGELMKVNLCILKKNQLRTSSSHPSVDSSLESCQESLEEIGTFLGTFLLLGLLRNILKRVHFHQLLMFIRSEDSLQMALNISCVCGAYNMD